MKGAVRIYKKPHPKACSMIAAWPGIGNVSLIVANYIKDKLGAEEIGEIDSPSFFEPTGVMVEDDVIEAPNFPAGKFYYWQNAGSGRDIALFICEQQPDLKVYELANCILDVGEKLKAGRIYTCAAALSRIHHTEEPKVWAVATDHKLIESLRKYKVVFRGKFHIVGLNGLFLGVAKERGIEGICLLGEVPTYAMRVANPKASLAILRVLTEVLGIEIDLTELTSLAKQADEEMKKLAAEAMSEFIGHFTEPIWERGEEEIN